MNQSTPLSFFQNQTVSSVLAHPPRSTLAQDIHEMLLSSERPDSFTLHVPIIVNAKKRNERESIPRNSKKPSLPSNELRLAIPNISPRLGREAPFLKNNNAVISSFRQKRLNNPRRSLEDPPGSILPQPPRVTPQPLDPLTGTSYFHPTKPLKSRLSSIDSVLQNGGVRFKNKEREQDSPPPLVSVRKIPALALRTFHGPRPMLISHTTDTSLQWGLPEHGQFSPQKSVRISQKALDQLKDLTKRRESTNSRPQEDLELDLPHLLRTQQLFSRKRESLSSVVHQRYLAERRSFTPTPNKPDYIDPQELFESLKQDALNASREAAKEPAAKDLPTRFAAKELQKMLTNALERRKLIRPIGVFKKANQAPIPASINLSGQNTALSSKIMQEGLKFIEKSPQPAFLAPLPADQQHSPTQLYRERKKQIPEEFQSISPRTQKSRKTRRLSSQISDNLSRKVEARPLVRRIIPQRFKRIIPIRELRGPKKQKIQERKRSIPDPPEFAPEPWGDSPVKNTDRLLFPDDSPLRQNRQLFERTDRLWSGGGRRDAGTNI